MFKRVLSQGKIVGFFCLLFLIHFLLFPSTFSEVFAQQIAASPKPVKIKQGDGTYLTIVGKGTIFVHWTETVDGYTLVRNKTTDVYDYAKLDDNGDLILSGLKAHDPKKRSKKECTYLKGVEKHLSYTGKKLEALQLEIKNNTTTQ